MQVLKREDVAIRSEDNVVHVRQRTCGIVIEVGFGLTDQTKAVTAASEMARNTWIYRGGGTATLEIVDDGRGHKGVRMSFADQGSGITDIQKALTDGCSSGTGLGLGLGGSRRLVNELESQSTPGEGTRVTLTKWR